MTPHPMLNYETSDARKQLSEILGELIPSYGSVYSSGQLTVDGYLLTR